MTVSGSYPRGAVFRSAVAQGSIVLLTLGLSVVLLSPSQAQTLHITGKWTTVSNAQPGSRWDSLGVGGDLRTGGGTHMALVRDSLNNAWVVHWHDGPRARIWKTVTNQDVGLGIGVPLDRHHQIDPFCSGHSLLADGRLLVVGGTLTDTIRGIGTVGTNRIVAYNPSSKNWSPRDAMALERWYATSTTLGDGQVLATGGKRFTTLSAFGGRKGGTLHLDLGLMTIGEYAGWLGGDPTDPTIGTRPSRREGHSMTPSGALDKSVLWGGRDDSGTKSPDSVWFLNSAEADTGKLWGWARLLPDSDTANGRPVGRAWHSATVLGDTLFIYGGKSNSAVLGDLWMLKE